MKSMITLFIAWSLSLPLEAAKAEKNDLLCKYPNFESYKKANLSRSEIEKSIKQGNQPNFSKKYRLITIEYAMETAWYLLDCETGEFVPETLYTSLPPKKAVYHLESDLLQFTDGSPPQNILETHRFKDDQWFKTNLETPYANSELYTQFPIKPNDSLSECKSLDFSSYERAESYKKAIQSLNPDLAHPNFDGHYLLMRAESIFESYWLIADCITGKFSKTFIAGSAQFKKDSRLLKIFKNGKHPKHFLWMEDDQQWVQIRTSESSGDPIKNTIFGKIARQLFNTAPNPEKKNIVRFENLKWNDGSTIITGKCINETGSPRCDIEF